LILERKDGWGSQVLAIISVETVLVVSEDVLKRVLLPTDWWTPEVTGR
jgi:hypothetical protein